MTRREFDRETQENRGPGLASDERDYYRHARRKPLQGSGATAPDKRRDALAERARERARYPEIGLRGLRTAPKRIGWAVWLLGPDGWLTRMAPEGMAHFK